MTVKNLKVLIRGGGELASAVACRMAESHFKVIMTELSRPQAVRLNVSFCEAVYVGMKTVKGGARLVASATQAQSRLEGRRAGHHRGPQSLFAQRSNPTSR